MTTTEYTPRENDPKISRDLDNELEAPPLGNDNSASQSLDVPSHLQGELEAEPAMYADPEKQVSDKHPDAEKLKAEQAETETPAETTQQAEGTEQADTTTTAQAEADKAFSTDFKYKVRDEEHEIEDWAKPLIKDEKTFKKFQDLYTRGHGLELAKQERDTHKQKLDTLEQSLNVVNGYVQQYYKDPANPENGANAARQFIESLGLPKQMFLQYALGELKYQQLPPEQKAAIDAQRQQEAQLQQMQVQQQTLQQQNYEMAVQQHNMALNAALAEPNTAQIANEYDARTGTPGSFREFVVQRGIYHSQNGIVKSVPEVVDEAIKMLGITPQGTGTQTGQAGTQQIQNTPQQQMPAQQTMQAQQQKPVLPNISGQGTASPVARTIKSIDDIRARYNELMAGQ